jgi:thymidylate kinase
MNKFIVFEGLDGTGKTTLAKLFADKVGGVYYYTPPKVLENLRAFADNSSPLTKTFYYMLGVAIASEEIKELLKTKSVVADHWIYCTIAFHSVLLGHDLDMPKEILIPDKIVYVTASWDEIKKRLESRETKEKYEEVSYLEEVDRKYQKLFSNQGNVITIDNTFGNLDNMVDFLVKKIGM